MNLIRDNSQAFLYEVNRAAKRSADAFRNAALRTESVEESDFFYRVARERDEIAARLDGDLEAMNELPAAPDSDRESLEHLLDRLRSALSAEPHAKLIEQQLESERRLAAALETPVAAELPTLYRNHLDALGRHIDQVTRRLREM